LIDEEPFEKYKTTEEGQALDINPTDMLQVTMFNDAARKYSRHL